MGLLTITSAVISAAAALPYLVRTWKGALRPQPVSWAAWAALLAVWTVAARQARDPSSAFYAAVCVAENGAVAVLALRIPAAMREPPARIGRLRVDVLCACGAMLGLILLAAAKSPALAITAAIATDAVAFIPTVTGAWKDPAAELWQVYLLYASATGLLLAAAWIHASGVPPFTAWVMPAWLTLADGTTGLLILARGQQQDEGNRLFYACGHCGRIYPAGKGQPAWLCPQHASLEAARW